jgi:hypothetical protein
MLDEYELPIYRNLNSQGLLFMKEVSVTYTLFIVF